MLDHIRRNAVAYLALFVALGGASYAALKLPAGSVGTAQLRAGAVTGSRLAKGAVTAQKVKRGALTASDFQKGSLPQGPSGPKGDPGIPGLSASAFADDAASSPPVGGTQSVIKQVTINMSQSGKLVILGAAIESDSFDNTSASPVMYGAGVYVDGVGVPGTSVSCAPLPALTTAPVCQGVSLPPGLLPNVTAGSHTVSVVVRTAATQSNYMTAGSGRVLAVASG